MQPQTLGKILVVDDQLVHRELLTSALDEYETTSAETAEAALEILDIFKPDIILLDVELAESTGYELCRTIRSLPNFKFCKIAFISSHTSVERRLEGYAAGGDDYITKPINVLEVAAKLRVLMRLKAVEEVDQLKRGFLSLITHETMTPLTIIRGYCDVLKQSPTLATDSARQSLGSISDATERLIELMQKAMLCSTLQDAQSLSLQPIPIQALVAELCLSKQIHADKKHLVFERVIEPETIPANQTLLSKALGFILDNAIRFSPEGGTIVLAGGRCAAGYRLEVSDSGPGIASAFIGQALQPFAVQDIAHHSRGSGLSLYLVKRIVELHGGTIQLSNNAHGGLLVSFELPPA